MLTGYLYNILIFSGIYAILTVSLNMAVGFTGLLNLGHVAFFGIGAYTSTLLTMNGVPYIVSLIVAGLVSSVFGVILMYAVRKLKGDYLALATLGFSFVVYSVMLNWSSLTRGPLGIPGIPKPELFGWTINTTSEYLVFTLIVATVSIYIINRITTSRYGKLLEAVRDDEVGLSVYGKPIFSLKVRSLAISAFFAGIAGSLFAHHITFIDPSSFYINDLVLLLTIVLVGGLANNKGVIIATVIIMLIPEALRFVDMPSSILGPARQMIYAIVLIGILLFKPRGLFGRIDLE